MANAGTDENGTHSMIAVESTTGNTIVAIQVDPTNHGLKVDDNNTGSDLGPTNALKDQNDASTLMGISSVDGVTLVPVYGHSGMLLIDSS